MPTYIFNVSRAAQVAWDAAEFADGETLNIEVQRSAEVTGALFVVFSDTEGGDALVQKAFAGDAVALRVADMALLAEGASWFADIVEVDGADQYRVRKGQVVKLSSIALGPVGPVAPTASLAPTLTPTGATTMTATLEPDQANGGAALDDRTLVITVNGSAITPVTGLAAEATHTITGLSAGDTVVARVDVTNAAGTTQGATATAQTWQLPATMAAPTLVGATGAATLEWPAAPVLNGRPLTANGYRYEVTLASDPTFASVVASGQQTDLTDTSITPLAAGSYIARVWAVTDAGAGVKSAASTAATVAAAPSSLTSPTASGGAGTIDASVTTATLGEALHLVVVASGATAPSAAQIAAGNDATGSAAAASATIASGDVVSGANSFAQITGLSAATYDVYFAQGAASTFATGVIVTAVFLPSGAAGVWGSATMVEGYTGPLLRVISGATGLPETDLFAGPDGRVSDADILAFTTPLGVDELFIERWYDQSGNERHAIFDGTGRPKIMDNGVISRAPGGAPAVHMLNTREATVSNYSNGANGMAIGYLASTDTGGSDFSILAATTNFTDTVGIAVVANSGIQTTSNAVADGAYYHLNGRAAGRAGNGSFGNVRAKNRGPHAMLIASSTDGYFAEINGEPLAGAVGGAVERTVAGGNPPANTSTLVIGNNNTLTFRYSGYFSCFYYYDRALSASERAGANSAIQSSYMPGRAFVVEGGSITEGFLADNATIVNQLIPQIDGSVFELGNAGDTISDMSAQAPYTVDALSATRAEAPVLILQQWYNTLLAATPAQAVQQMSDYVAARKSAGAGAAIIIDMPKFGVSPSGNRTEANRLILNGLIKAAFDANESWIDELVVIGDPDDNPADPFNDPTNTTYYNADRLHFTGAGYGVIADRIAAAIARLGL